MKIIKRLEFSISKLCILESLPNYFGVDIPLIFFHLTSFITAM
jgi:hypothetical protein